MKLLLLSFLVLSPLLAEEENSINKHQIPYLMQQKRVSLALDLYQKHYIQQGKHDFEVLEDIARVLLEEGLHESDDESQLLSIFGMEIAGYVSALDALQDTILSPHPDVQLAAIHLLGQMQDDLSDTLLTKAMSSELLGIRLEAASQLALRKHSSATGQIEALMYRIPHEMRFLFPQLFALIGTKDAISTLKHMIEDSNATVRVEALLAAARYGRDDLLPLIRTHATHLNIAEEEASATALGMLKDTHSLKKLQKLATSPSSNVKLASLHALYLLGDLNAKDKIEEMAKERYLFAVALLAEIPGSEETLAALLSESDLQLRLNAAIALLHHRDARAVSPLLELLVRDSRDLGIEPQFSVGRSLMTWKIVSSLRQRPESPFYNRQAVSLSVREHLLRECLELPEEAFLGVAEAIFKSRQTDLVPLLVKLLENVRTEKALHLLKTMSKATGAPLIRGYCNLALFRLHQEGPYRAYLTDWLSQKKHSELIRFRPLLTLEERFKDSSFELTPEESSRLLIEVYSALAEQHDTESIDMLLDAIRSGHPKNRYALAGLLIATLQ